MQFTLPELPDVTLNIGFDPAVQQITLVGTKDGVEVLRASVFHGVVPPEPAPTYFVPDPEPAP